MCYCLRAGGIGPSAPDLARAFFHFQDTENLPKSQYTILNKKQYITFLAY